MNVAPCPSVLSTRTVPWPDYPLYPARGWVFLAAHLGVCRVAEAGTTW